MLVPDLAAFCAAVAPSGALLGLDPGEKRIGIAVCDPARTIASPLVQLTRTRFAADAAAVFAALSERAGVGLVIGLPLNMDGSAGPAAQSARAFARNLLAVRDVPILMWDERWTTAAVERSLIAADTTRKRRADVRDKLAAAYMLQGAIDAMANLPAITPGPDTPP